MSATILSAIISAAAATVSAITVAVIQHRKTVALLEYRLGQLEAKVDKHNNLVERTYALEKETALMESGIKAACRRLDDLERQGASV